MAKFVFYHATPAENVHSIMEKGIKGVVYLTRFPKQAESFPCQAARELHKGINEWAVLKLVLDDFPWKLTLDPKWGELGVYKAENVDIDPKHIMLYKRLDLSESYQRFKELYLNTNPGTQTKQNCKHFTGNGGFCIPLNEICSRCPQFSPKAR